MQVKQIENILRAKSGVPQNQLCLVIPLSYHESPKRFKQQQIRGFYSDFFYWILVPAEELQPLNLFINLCDAKSTVS